MISTTWIEECYIEPSGIHIHKTIALHGNAIENVPFESRTAWVEYETFTPFFVATCRYLTTAFRISMLRRMHRIIMQISGSPTGE